MESYDPVTDRPAGENTPAWAKWILLTLLFSAAAGGIATGGWILYRQVRSAAHAGIPLPRPVADQTDPAKGDAETPQGKTLLDLIKWPSEAIVFQGTGAGRNGELIAMISGESVAAGEELNGVRVLEISKRNVLLEFNGQTYRLEPGEQLKP